MRRVNNDGTAPRLHKSRRNDEQDRRKAGIRNCGDIEGW